MNAGPARSCRRSQVHGTLSDFLLVRRPAVYISRDAEFDWLSAFEFGIPDDGQPAMNWRQVSPQVAYLHEDEPHDSPAIGFKVLGLGELDLDDPEHRPLWEPPFFDAPQLGLVAAPAAEIILAALALFAEASTMNRILFAMASNSAGEDALAGWLACLGTGDPMAHFGAGYTLYELGRHHAAYRHLRFYSEIAPAQPWVWVWYGKAAEAIGELGEARSAYEIALELEDEDEQTDAAVLLRRLEGREA